ncbi:hypothetical protein KHU50_011007 [Colletotrichum sp. SAR 10_65]|nr:hypothetical protein KHU50_011007 [Colletotrichum sp. SAR 10_65]
MPLAARASPAAQRIIRDAFKDLERTISSEDSADFATTTLDKVIQAAHDVENQLAARQLLRNMRRLTPLFDGLQHYSKSIEAACEGTPYMAWIWAPIKIILKILHQTFNTNVELQQTFALFYSDILKFHKEAYKFVRRAGWKVFFMTSWGHFERRFDGIIDDLKAHEKLVDNTANVVGLSQMKKMRDNVEALRREAAEQVDRQERERIAKYLLDIVSWLKIDNNQQAKISDMITAELQKYPQTRDWILDQKKISTWMRLDGLDECDKETQSKVISILERMEAKAIATTSTVWRKEKAAIMKAIASYAAQRLGELKARMDFKEDELKCLELQLATKADGMFLWARLVLNYLTNNMFILAKIISHFDQRSVSRLQSIMGWIAFAKRPLRKAELRSALSFSTENDGVNVQELAPTYLFDMCMPLIEERSDTTFSFIHISVKDFLMSSKSTLVCCLD